MMSTDKTDILEEEEVISESSDETETKENKFEDDTLETERDNDIIDITDEENIVDIADEENIIDITADEDIIEVIDEETEEAEGDVAEVIDINPVLEVQKKLDEALKTNEELTTRLRSISEAFRKKSEEVNATRKRLERQGEYKEAKTRGDVVSSIFEPFENLKRSITGLQNAEVDESHVQGLEMVKDEFWNSLQKLGLEEIPGKGSFFDPNIHQALTSMPVTDPNLNNIVVQVYGTGYRINDIVIKPAQVIVGMFTAPPVAEKSPVEENTEENAEETVDVNVEVKDNSENKDEASSTENDES